MRYEIQIGQRAHRDVHRIAVSITGAPPTDREKNGRTVQIAPDIVDATFVRSPELPSWRCEEVQIGGGVATLDEHGTIISVRISDRREVIYPNAMGMPSWLALILDELMTELPE